MSIPTNVSDVSNSLQSWLSVIQSVVLTANVFTFYKTLTSFDGKYTINSNCIAKYFEVINLKSRVIV